MADGRIVIDTSLDNSGIQKGISGLSGVVNKGMSSVVKSVGAASVAFAAAGGFAIKTGVDFESGMSEVSAISGATADEITQLTEKAKEMGAKTKFSASESAEAFKYMAMAGWKTGDMLNGIEGVMNLAAASGEDLATVSDIVTDALTAFGLQASDSAHFADVLAKASSNSNTNVGMMGATFKYVAPLAGSMGYTIEDTAVAIGLMANAGIKGEQAGTALRAMFTRLANPPKDAATAMEKLGISITNTDGTMKPLSETMGDLREAFAGLSEEQKIEYASSLAGQEAMSGLLAIVNAAPEDYEKLSTAIANSGGAAKGAAAIMQDNLKGAVEELMGGLETLGLSFYETFSDDLKACVKQGTAYVDELTEAFDKDGLLGVVEKSGDIFADLATGAAKQAPKMVTAATKFIEAFVNGIKKNSSKLLKAAGDIAKTLSGALIKLLPKAMQKPVKDAVDSIIKTLTGPALKKAFKTLSNLFQNTGKIIGKLAKVVLPPLTKAFEFCAEHTDLLVAATVAAVAAFKGYAIVKTLSGSVSAFSAIMAALTAAEAANTLQTMADAGALTAKEIVVGTLTGKITLATAAHAAWNAVMNANPIGLLITAVGVLTAGVVAYCLTQEDTLNLGEQVEQQFSEQIEKVNETVQSWKELQEAQKEQMETGLAEIGHTQQLWEELKKITDENGRVKQGYEDRAGFIVSQLSEALGLEIEMNDGVIKGYQELSESIDDVIEKKKAQIVLDSLEDSYRKAITEKQKLLIEQARLEADIKQRQLEIDKHHTEIQDLEAQAAQAVAEGNDKKAASIQMAIALAESEYAKEEAALEKVYEQYRAGDGVLQGYYNTINTYESLAAAIVSGKTDEISAALDKASGSFKTASEATYTELKKQNEDAEAAYNYLLQKVSDGWTNITKEQLDEAKALVDKTRQELDRAEQEFPVSMDNSLSATVDVMRKYNPLAQKEAKSISDQSNKQLGSADTKGTGDKQTRKYHSGFISNVSSIISAARGISDDAGATMGEYDTYSVGADFSRGFLNGLNSLVGSIVSAAANMVNQAVASAKNAGGIKSPSRVMMKVGRFFPQGGAIGIRKDTPMMVSAMVDMVKESVGKAKQLTKNQRMLSFDLGIGDAQVSAMAEKMRAAVAAQRAAMTSKLTSKVNAKVVSHSDEADVFDYDKMADKFANRMDSLMRRVSLKYNNREVARMVREVLPT